MNPCSSSRVGGRSVRSEPNTRTSLRPVPGYNERDCWEVILVFGCWIIRSWRGRVSSAAGFEFLRWVGVSGAIESTFLGTHLTVVEVERCVPCCHCVSYRIVPCGHGAHGMAWVRAKVGGRVRYQGVILSQSQGKVIFFDNKIPARDTESRAEGNVPLCLI